MREIKIKSICKVVLFTNSQGNTYFVHKDSREGFVRKHTKEEKSHGKKRIY